MELVRDQVLMGTTFFTFTEVLIWDPHIVCETLFYCLIFLDGDFWAFDVQSAWWSTIHGGNGMAFGVKGQPSASVFPGIKYASSCILNGIDNRFYLFAGRTAMSKLCIFYRNLTSAMENHLWAYDFLLSQWAWLGGNNTVRTAYSVGRGIESPLNVPAARGTYFSAQTLNALTTVNALLMFGGGKICDVNALLTLQSATMIFGSSMFLHRNGAG